jgi:hypothetical protein
MAKIRDVTLRIENGSVQGKQKVTVKFNLLFSETEAGKRYRYDIRLRGDEPPGDQEVGEGEVLSDFRFGLLSLPTRTITAQEGERPFTEIRSISISDLNEDDGTHPLVDIPHFPDDDEIYAEVSLSRRAGQFIALLDKERSPTVTKFF